MKTYAPKPQDIERRWYVIDADGVVLGRLATEVAAILRGKHKPIFAPHADTGDNVIVINAKAIELTGAKRDKKFAYRHSGYPGGLTATRYGHLLEQKPAHLVEKAVKGMLPHNRLGRAMVKKLHVYEGPTHRHEAQQPVPLKLGEVPPWQGLPAPEAEPVETKPASATSAAKPKTTAKRQAVKASTTKASTTKASTTKASTTKASTTKASTTKASTAKSTAKRGTTKPADKPTKTPTKPAKQAAESEEG